MSSLDLAVCQELQQFQESARQYTVYNFKYKEGFSITEAQYYNLKVKRLKEEKKKRTYTTAGKRPEKETQGVQRERNCTDCYEFSV